MAQEDFPVNDLASNLQDLQASLEEAESSCNRDKELSQAIQDAKDAAEEVENNLKTTQ